MHATVRQDLILGLTLTAFFCMVYFVLIPLGIEVPHSHDPGQLSPAAYPSWIALAGLGASLLLTANTILKHLRLRRAARKPGQSRAPELGRIDSHPSGLRAALSLLLLH